MYDIFFLGSADTSWNVVKSKYSNAQRLEKNTTFDDIRKKSFTKLFWIIWDDVVLDAEFNLNEYKTTQWDNMYIHVFKNKDHFDGICLFPKNITVSKREFRHRFFSEKKEIDIVASVPKKYNVYSLNTFEEYQQITDEMFWCIWPEIVVTDTTVFDMYFSHHNSYDRRENHVFKHLFNNKEIYTYGVILFSKEKKISQREFRHRFLIEKKEHNKLVSKHKLYDVVFISYNESNADENFNKLLSKCPRAKRVHRVKGIHQAHIAAAKLCDTDMIWVVDGDAVVVDNFKFDLTVSSYDTDCVHVWRGQNPINNLVYGNGGVKLLPRYLTLNMDVNTADMTTSISKKFKAVQDISNITAFNTDEFTTWRSAFRECAKLASRVIDRQHDDETQQRLDTWCTVGSDQMYGRFAISGALLGKQYGLENKNNPNALVKINDFEWLQEQFDGRQR